MKCPKCQVENKEGAKSCRKCGTEIAVLPVWKPTWKWHLRTLLIIYTALILLFFMLNHLLKPYMREIPKNITPWLNEVPHETKVG